MATQSRGAAMYYTRQTEKQIKSLETGFPVLAITGPRQSGKTTLMKHYFSKYSYFNLENPQVLSRIEVDPQTFLDQNSGPILIDEVQRMPQLLSYIQVHVDAQQVMGSIVVSGSENLLLAESISQSLAGRAAYQVVLPFSIEELKNNSLLTTDAKKQMYKGFYPALYSRDIEPNTYYNQYLATYIERDVRQIKNIADLSLFRKFLGLLAGRVGQILNVSSLANDTGISPNTAEQWISVLEASYIVYRLRPYYKNMGKRLIKSPKLYFYDTGLVSALLGIASATELATHYAMGNIFENMIVIDVLKHLYNHGQRPDIFFYRDSNGREIDLLYERGEKIIPIEIKSSSTFHNSFLDGLSYWRKNIDSQMRGYVIYAGKSGQRVGQDELVAWHELGEILRTI